MIKSMGRSNVLELLRPEERLVILLFGFVVSGTRKILEVRVVPFGTVLDLRTTTSQK